jgi:hypothetical protein
MCNSVDWDWIEDLIVAEPLTENAGWLELLEGFRSLGGIAENIGPGRGERGRGLFAQDPSRPVRLHIPENLLLPVKDVVFRNNRFCVSDSCRTGGAEKAWLEHYENEYSWGAGGRAEMEDFLENLWGLPEQVRGTLNNLFSMAICLQDPCPELVQTRFLDSRVIEYSGSPVVMPLVEMVNHGPCAGYDCTNGVGISGKFDDEVLVNYGTHDSFAIFASWGFASEERIALSIPRLFGTTSGKITIKREMNACDQLEFRGTTVELPKLVIGENGAELSFLMLGSKGFPRLPKGIFHRVFRNAGRPFTDEPFELIQHFNRLHFLELIKELEGLSGPLVTTIRNTCRFQLVALSHCYGNREI